ncbi:NUDIX hydrolase [Aeromicrobium marinum]
MRREGVLRGGSDADRVLVARLADDPPLDSRDAFIAILNAGLPTKRVISQGLVRDPAGRVLMCELTYKTEWDLPGGVIEVGESPAVGLVRELSEELGVTVEVRGLLTVTWLPAWRGWDDACMFLFDLGVAEPEIVDTFDLQANEIAAVHWCTPDDLSARATAASQEMLRHVREGTVTAYRDAPLAP